jgi:hypothetical protein
MQGLDNSHGSVREDSALGPEVPTMPALTGVGGRGGAEWWVGVFKLGWRVPQGSTHQHVSFLWVDLSKSVLFPLCVFVHLWKCALVCLWSSRVAQCRDLPWDWDGPRWHQLLLQRQLVLC